MQAPRLAFAKRDVALLPQRTLTLLISLYVVALSTAIMARARAVTTAEIPSIRFELFPRTGLRGWTLSLSACKARQLAFQIQYGVIAMHNLDAFLPARSLRVAPNEPRSERPGQARRPRYFRNEFDVDIYATPAISEGRDVHPHANRPPCHRIGQIELAHYV